MLVRFFLLFLAAISLHAEPLPELKTPVTDLTGTLSKEQISNLENRILGLEKEKGSQIAIAIVPTTSAENIEQYSIRLATAWKIGRKGVDDGVLLVVAKQDRKLRIEVGYGLEGAIPDAYAKQIIDMTIVPRLREGKFYEGISDGLDRIISLIKTESLPPAQKEKAIPRMSNTEWMLAVLIHGGFWLRPALLVLGVILFIWKRDLKGLVIPLGIWLAWILFWSLRVQAFFFSGLISAAVYSLVYYFFLNRFRSSTGASSSSSGWFSGTSSRSSTYRPTNSSYRSSSSSSSYRSSSSSSSSSSSRSSYSGSGGSFGGGGASGSW